MSSLRTAEILNKFENLEVLLCGFKSPNMIDIGNVRVVSRKNNLRGRMLLLFDIVKLQPDVFHLQYIWSFYGVALSIILRVFFKTKIIVSPRGMLEKWSLTQNTIKKKLALYTYTKLLFLITTAFHVTSDSEKAAVRIYSSRPSVLIPNPIAPPRLLKSDFNQKQIFLYISRIHEKKGLHLLLEAFKSLNNNNCELLIAGSGEGAYYQKMLEIINETPNIKFLGEIRAMQKEKVMSSADLLILPTYSENYGIVVAESLSRGVPVMTTRNTPWYDIEEFGAGYIVKTNSADILNGLSNWTKLKAEKRKMMSLKALKYYDSKFSLEMFTSSFKKLYGSKI